MATIVPITEAKAELSAYARRAGEGETFTLTVDGEPRADIGPSAASVLAKRRAAFAALDRLRRENPISLSDAELREAREWGRK